MTRVAVTGATGFVGNFVVQYLKSKGYQVFSFGRKDKAGIIHWDITSDLYENDLEIDVVVHCAANVSDWSSYDESYSVNVVGTKNVINSFPTASTFIYISSGSVYNPYCKEVLLKEDGCVGGSGLNNYGKTKLLGEKVVKNCSIKSKVILRPHIVYGPGDTTIGPRIKKAIRGNRFIVPGNGKNHISFTHVENLASAIDLSIIYSRDGTSIYNITDALSPTFNDAVEAFKKLNKLKFTKIHIPKLISIIIAMILELLYKLLKIDHAPILTKYIINQMTNDHTLDVSAAYKDLRYSPTKSWETDFYA